MTEVTGRILEILQDCPSGLSAKEVASQLRSRPDNISSRLSKLAAYGIITQAKGKLAPNSPGCAIYSIPSIKSCLTKGTKY
jgi:DNA-binding Lrp family transcriptional regulator